MTGSTFILGKGAVMQTVVNPGKPILVTADGAVIDKDFKDVDAALQEARRLARKNDDDIYLYVPNKRVGPSEPKVEEVTL